VARDVKDAFKAALDTKRFHVEATMAKTCWSRRKAGVDFSIELLESS